MTRRKAVLLAIPSLKDLEVMAFYTVVCSTVWPSLICLLILFTFFEVFIIINFLGMQRCEVDRAVFSGPWAVPLHSSLVTLPSSSCIRGSMSALSFSTLQSFSVCVPQQQVRLSRSMTMISQQKYTNVQKIYRRLCVLRLFPCRLFSKCGFRYL